jgi:hypothetical protein
MTGEHRVPLARVRHPERGLDPVAQGAKDRAVIAVYRTRHDHHDRMQEIHRRFGVETGDPRGRTGDVREQNSGLLALSGHIGHTRVRCSRLTAPGAEAGVLREIPPAVDAYGSQRSAAGHAEPARRLVVVSACPASHSKSAVYWITSAVNIDANLALKKLSRDPGESLGQAFANNGRKHNLCGHGVLLSEPYLDA